MLALILFIASDTSIFDGRTLNGWETVGGGKWTVDGGVLKGQCTKSDEQGVLVYNKPVRDFIAKLQFRISSGNSGFYFRAERIKEQPLLRGFQAEVDAIEDVGGIWETAGRGWVSKPTADIHAATKFKPGAWTDMDISAIGSHYVIKLNGHTTADIEDAEGRKEGWIGLQLHGGVDMTVEFRNLHVTHK